MSFPRYPKYKDSGVEWLGEVPEHWDVAPLKRNVVLLTEKTDRRQRPVGLENIQGWTGRFIATESDFQGDGVAFEPGDLLFGKLRPYLAKVYLAESSGEAVGDFHVLRPLDSLHPRFGQYQLLCRQFIDQVDGSTFGSKMPRASWEAVGGFQLPVPPSEEQHAIGAFLDRETAKIDALVAEQERLIELLREKRQAVISHAVTKGLNPDAPMKDSGVEWLGEVPAHWEIVPSRRLFTQREERARPDDIQLTASQRHGILTQDEYSQLEGVRVMQVIKGADILKHVEPGDFVISMRSFQGGLEWANVRGCISSAYVMLIPRMEAVPEYFRHLFKCSTYIQALQATSNLVRDGQALRFANFALVPLPMPPSAEQATIAASIDRELERIDALVLASEAAAALLSTRRSALISAAVTGKIDVRHFATAEAA